MISGKNKELYYTSSIDKQLNIEVVGTRIVIDNSMREQDTFTLTEALNDGSELKFGSCLPNQISFIAHDMPAGLVGKTLRPVETLEGNEDDPFTYGEYKIFSAVPTADRTKRQITAYDAMYDILNADVKAWYAGLSFPMALKQFRNSFFAHLGIAQEETTLVNDSMTVNKTLVASSSEGSTVTAEATISGKTIIEAICEINGAFGNMNRAGKFEYVILPSITSALYPADDLYPRDDLFPSDANTESMTGHYITFDYEDFQSQAITQLEIRADDNTAGTIVGNPGNTYVISGNFLVSDKTGAELEQIANNVFPIMKQAAYTPLKTCTCVGNPCLELGDPIRFNTTREIVETYLLQRTLTGVQSKRDSIVAQGTPTHTTKTNSIRETLESVQRRTSKLEHNADHLLSQYEDLEKQTNTKLEQTASSFEMSVTGGDKTVGIVIKLLNSDGDVISESSENANITITGVVQFEDLAQAGATIINGANITTGTISCDRLDGGKINGQDIVGGRIASENIYCIDSLYMSNRMSWTGEDASLAGAEKVMYIPKNDTWVHFAPTVVFDSGVMFSSTPTVNGVLLATVNSTVNKAKNATRADSAKTASYVANTASSSHTANMYSNSDNKMYYCPQGSSRRFKTDIEPVKDKELDPHRLYDVDIVQFKYKPSFYGLPDDTPMDTVIGFIAEDIKKKYPCATEYDEETGAVNNWLERYIIPPMLSLIQEQHEEIEALKKKNEEFELRLSTLEGK
ncbi:MAG: tail fiber domain-containing protein [Agathobacter sp.]|nr:tail fiber domain-containing protein [Agathobacter sp.]